MQRGLLAILVGFGIGALLGAVIGWFAPIQDVSAGFDKLHPVYKADYAVMVGAAYSVSNDWDLAQSRLGRLAEPDPAAFLVQITEQAIAEGRSPDDIRQLVRLSARFGYTTSAMLPYLPAEGEQ